MIRLPPSLSCLQSFPSIIFSSQVSLYSILSFFSLAFPPFFLDFSVSLDLRGIQSTREEERKTRKRRERERERERERRRVRSGDGVGASVSKRARAIQAAMGREERNVRFVFALFFLFFFFPALLSSSFAALTWTFPFP